MNERIRELAEQAGAEIHGHPDYSTICVNGQDADALMKKFAELIIQECGKVAYEETEHFPKPCDWLLDEFKRHFGVEVEATRQALAQPEQEPVKCVYPYCETASGCDGPCSKPLTTPVDAINISQKSVDETVKGEHEPMNDRERLEKIVNVICRYLPPDGISIKTAMSEIIELVDPLPPKRGWVGLTDDEFTAIARKYSLPTRVGLEYFKDELEAKLKEKNT